MRDHFIDILVVTLIECLMELRDESEKGMDGSRWQGLTPLISTTLQREEEEYVNKLITIDFMRFTEMKKIINVLSYGCSFLTVKI